jgi:hypothetical protein
VLSSTFSGICLYHFYVLSLLFLFLVRAIQMSSPPPLFRGQSLPLSAPPKKSAMLTLKL